MLTILYSDRSEPFSMCVLTRNLTLTFSSRFEKVGIKQCHRVVNSSLESQSSVCESVAIRRYECKFWFAAFQHGERILLLNLSDMFFHLQQGHVLFLAHQLSGGLRMFFPQTVYGFAFGNDTKGAMVIENPQFINTG